MKKFLSFVTLTALSVAPAMAGVIVPAPEVGGGLAGMMVAGFVVYLIHRRGSRSGRG